MPKKLFADKAAGDVLTAAYLREIRQTVESLTGRLRGDGLAGVEVAGMAGAAGPHGAGVVTARALVDIVPPGLGVPLPHPDDTNAVVQTRHPTGHLVDVPGWAIRVQAYGLPILAGDRFGAYFDPRAGCWLPAGVRATGLVRRPQPGVVVVDGFGLEEGYLEVYDSATGKLYDGPLVYVLDANRPGLSG